jgi:hypothetical protein
MLAWVLSLALLVTFGQIATAGDIPKEGTFSGKSVVWRDFVTLAKGEERLQLHYKCGGVFINDKGEGFLHNAR